MLSPGGKDTLRTEPARQVPAELSVMSCPVWGPGQLLPLVNAHYQHLTETQRNHPDKFTIKKGDESEAGQQVFRGKWTANNAGSYSTAKGYRLAVVLPSPETQHPLSFLGHEQNSSRHWEVRTYRDKNVGHFTKHHSINNICHKNFLFFFNLNEFFSCLSHNTWCVIKQCLMKIM